MLGEYLGDNPLTGHLEAVYRRFLLISESICSQPIKRHYFQQKKITNYHKYKGMPRKGSSNTDHTKVNKGKTLLKSNLDKVVLAPRFFIILLLHNFSNLLQLLFLHQDFYFFPQPLSFFHNITSCFFQGPIQCIFLGLLQKSMYSGLRRN